MIVFFSIFIAFFLAQNLIYIDHSLHLLQNLAQNFVYIDVFHEFIAYFFDRILFISMIFLNLSRLV